MRFLASNTNQMRSAPLVSSPTIICRNFIDGSSCLAQVLLRSRHRDTGLAHFRRVIKALDPYDLYELCGQEAVLALVCGLGVILFKYSEWLQARRSMKCMNILDIIGIVIFFVVVGLGLLAVFDVFFASPRNRKRRMARSWKHPDEPVKSTIYQQVTAAFSRRRARCSRRHRGGSA
jgi:hypothetical protein